jgi:hypothetical protein
MESGKGGSRRGRDKKKEDHTYATLGSRFARLRPGGAWVARDFPAGLRRLASYVRAGRSDCSATATGGGGERARAGGRCGVLVLISWRGGGPAESE